VRYIVSLSLMGLALWLLGGTSAWAASGVERTSPFTDYRQAVQDEYSTTTTPQGPGPQQGPNTETQTPNGQNPPNGNEEGAVGGENQTNPGTGNGPGKVLGDTAGEGSSSLPFTGFNLLTLVLLGVLLVAVGALIRVAQRTRRAVRLARS
jgi:hypothetical protein